MAGLISSEELLKRLKKKGYDISISTIRYYGDLGLIPRSQRVSRGKHEAGTQGMYHPGLVDQIVRIKKLQEEGKSLEEIRKIVKASYGKQIVSESLRVARGEVEADLQIARYNLNFIKHWLEDEKAQDKLNLPLLQFLENLEGSIQRIIDKLESGEVEADRYDDIAERLVEAFSIFRRGK